MPEDIDKLTRCVNGTEIKSIQSLITFKGKLSCTVATPFLNDLTTAIVSCSVVGSRTEYLGNY